MAKRVITAGLLWHSLNSGNLGVGALTLGNAAIARQAAAEAGVDLRFVVIAPYDPAPPFALEGLDGVVHVTGRSMVSPSGVAAAFRRVDCILDIGAGDSFADIYGAKRFAYVWGTKMLALALRRPLILSPQTIGPFRRQPYERLAGLAMKGARLTVARDPISFDEIARLAPGARRLMSADVAFRLPFTRRAKAEDGRAHVGVNVSGLLWRKSGGDGGFGLTADYAAFMTGVIEHLVADPAYQVHFIAHANDHAGLDDDAGVADELARRYPGTIRVPDFAGPSEAKSYISGLDFLVAARMHACIAAFSSGVPVVPVAYSRKFHGLFEGVLEYPHVLTLEKLSEDAAVAFVTDRLARRDELARGTEAGNARAQALLDDYAAALVALFRDIASTLTGVR